MSITFEVIQKANAAIQTTDIKGKDYAEVNQRIKAFRMVYPQGGISTEILDKSEGIIVMKATVADENGTVLATGTAYEKENSSFINKTSYIENCETSAIGRALGIAGFGIDTSVASYEEVANAITNQKKAETITLAEAKKLEKLIEAVPAQAPLAERIERICGSYGVEKLVDLNSDQYAELVKRLQA